MAGDARALIEDRPQPFVDLLDRRKVRETFREVGALRGGERRIRSTRRSGAGEAGIGAGTGGAGTGAGGDGRTDRCRTCA